MLGKTFRTMKQGEREEGKEVPSRQIRAECSLRKLPGGPETSSEQGADPRQGNVMSDGSVIQHRRWCSLLQN